LRNHLRQLFGIVHRFHGRSVPHDVRVAMRNHHQVSCIQDLLFTARQADESTAMSEQMKNNHVVCRGSKLSGQRAADEAERRSGRKVNDCLGKGGDRKAVVPGPFAPSPPMHPNPADRAALAGRADVDRSRPVLE